MSFGSRVSENREPTLRESYIYNNQPRTPNHRLEEIRKKYDTPTRRDIKEPENKGLSNNYQPKGNYNNPDRWNSKEGLPSDVSHSHLYEKENIKSEEEAVLRKIKEMKEAVKNKNFQDKIKTTNSIYQHKPIQKDPKYAHLSEQRVQSIDKINNKIQHILSCLRENENRTMSVLESDQRTTDILNNSKITDHNKSVSRTTMGADSKIFEQSVRRDKVPEFRNIPQAKNTTSVYQNEKKVGLESPAGRIVPSFELSSRQERLQRSKSRSYICQTQKNQVQSKYEMKNGKKLDDQITKIEHKIQQFEQQKKKLNIDFKPYSYSNSKSVSNLNKRGYTADKHLQKKPVATPENTNEKVVTRFDRSTVYSRNSFEPNSNISNVNTNSKNIQTSQINVSISKVSEKSVEDQFKIKLIPVEAEQKNTISSRVSEQNTLNDELRSKTNEGILDRKKKLNTNVANGPRPTVKRLVQKLSKQVELDEKFRNLKLWFQSILDKDKWNKLQNKLNQKSFLLEKQLFESTFNVSDQENNPFFSVRDVPGDFETLVKAYAESQEHWKQHLFQNLSKNDLKNEDFSENSIDLEKKGSIVIEDIVRFLNMETGTFYRNRDIYLIYKRISSEPKISFNDFFVTFCK